MDKFDEHKVEIKYNLLMVQKGNSTYALSFLRVKTKLFKIMTFSVMIEE